MTQITRKFYYLRHHRTDAHDLEQMCGGGSDKPLNQQAEAELMQCSPAIQKILHDVETIYTTSLRRAFQSASAVNQGWNKPIRIVGDLREWHLGEWEGKPWRDLPHPFTFDGRPPGGEARDVFRGRVVRAIGSLVSSDNNFLIVGHGIAFHEISQHLLGTAEYIETAELAVLEAHDDHWHFRRLPYQEPG